MGRETWHSGPTCDSNQGNAAAPNQELVADYLCQYTTNFKRGQNDVEIQVNYTGNSTKTMHIAVEASLKKLRTSYIDILYVHYWDFNTSIEEVMDSLHHLVATRKVLYLGISDTPAWIVAYANRYAKDHGKTPFSIYQGMWNVMARSFERDIIPMARTLGLALAPWNVLNGGRLRTDEEERKREESGEGGRTYLRSANWKRTEDERKMSAALEKVAKEVGTEHITAVAIAYIMQKTPYVFPIIGGRKVEHLYANIEALKITLSDDQIKYLESIIPFDLGFPHNIFVSNFFTCVNQSALRGNMQGDGTHAFTMVQPHIEDRVEVVKAIKPTL